MRIFHTKYASMTDDELLQFADKYQSSLTELGRELMYRLEDVVLHPEDHEIPIVMVDRK